MRYAILGTTQVLDDDGTPVPLGGARLRALLTAFAARPGRTLPAGVLVAEVWADNPPADAPAALQALVGRLRRTLGHAAVDSVDGGYRLAAGREDVDLFRFERLAADGARSLAAGAAADAAARYDEALALWRGPALADLPDRTAEAARWEAVHLDARRGRLTAALALGQAERSLPELTALCAERPLDEPLHALRIRALRDAGRPAEALHAYETVRKELAGRLGADPGPELRALHAELLAPGPAAPAPAAPPAPAGPPPGNLRARLTTFVGREADIAAIGADLARARLVTLLGPGGAGKTRLSQEAAEAAAADGHWPDGVWLAELAPVEDPDDVAEAVLSALGAHETSRRGAASDELRVLADRSDDAMQRLTEYCARRRMLLLLDNCEHVVLAAARLAEDLLARCPGVRILATSREPLGVPGESLRPVEPLPAPVALRLLADRGAAARPGFSPQEDPAAAAEICRRLDGLPLAIELAAARLRLLTPRQIADRLDDRFRLLTSGSRTVLPRQQTLRAVVDWSWDLLEEPERALLRRLSVFAGGCDLAAAETVCADGGLLGPLDVADALGSLVDKSLVVAAAGPPAGEMRYRLLETVAEYAAERLAEAGEDRAATEQRHLVHYRELARRTEPLLRGRTQRPAAALVRTEYENFRTALRRAVAARDEHEVICLVHSLVWYWHMNDLRSESRHWSRAAAALGPDPFAPPVAPAPPVHEQVVDSPPPYSGDLLDEARRGIRLIELAARDQATGDWHSPEVRELIHGMVTAYRPGLPQVCRNPGGLWFYAVMIAGDADLLRTVIDANVETCRAFGYTWELASALQLRANVLANRADWVGSAARDAEESLALFEELGDDWGCAEALSARGEAHERRGGFAEAAEAFRAAGEYACRLGAEAQVTVLRVRLAGVLAELGEGEEAEQILTEVVATRQQFGNEAMPAARMFLATRLARTGRTAEARAQLDSLRAEFAFGAYAIFDGFLLGMLAWLDNLEGRYSDALPSLWQALAAADDPLVRMVAPQMPAVYLMTAAGSLAGLARPADAARLLGAYRAHLPAGHFPTLIEREGFAAAEESARAQLGDTAYESAYAEGGGLSYEEATALMRP
ncbi:AAA family ATPase [Streptomyces bambusae]|uniref:BTAD domain-containing putative transcriptional regulator n=1 Tax=Streptomyces bambusae TaxID=1550616 RepID=UPI001CFFB9DC|nr:BTAD domain-containing putative transcriptional regulator [Streptomyces bambusae]MCB5170025.1 AAA family ATPase [Streptomyces bambusae]